MARDENGVSFDLLTDRISALPDFLIDCILGHLSNDFGVVVRTSVLSKRWRFCWKRARKLVFDDLLYEFIGTRRLDVCSSIINSVLSRLDGPVDEFVFSATMAWNNLFKMDGRLGERRDIDLSIQLLTDKGIRKFTLTVLPLCFYSLPSCLLNCSTLTHLSLSYCSLGPSLDFRGVSNLVDLHLDSSVVSVSLLENMISRPAQLKALHLNNLVFSPEVEFGRQFIINAPGLKRLFVHQVHEPFYLKEAPSLTYADVLFSFNFPTIGHRKVTNLDNFVRVIPRIETLKIHCCYMPSFAVVDIPMKLPRTLQNLKDLEFVLDILSLDQLACVFCLMRSSPNLQSLKIHVCYGPSTDEDDVAIPAGFYEAQGKDRFYEAQGKEGISSRLTRVEFSDLQGKYCEVELISAILNSCPMLATILFSCQRHTEIDSELLLFKELAKLSRPASATMEFQSRYKDKDAAHPLD